MKTIVTLLAASGLVAVCLVACGHHKPVVVEPTAEADAGGDGSDVDSAPSPTVYDRLGAKDGVAAVIEAFLGNLNADKRVNKLFAKTTGPRLDHFKQMFADQLCEAAGGGCPYTGKTMKDAHQGMGITDAQFNAFIEDLTLALEEKQVSKDDQQALLSKLTPMMNDIVEKKGAAKK